MGFKKTVSARIGVNRNSVPLQDARALAQHSIKREAVFDDRFREYQIEGGRGVGQADLTISDAHIGRVNSAPQGREKPGVLRRP